VTGRMINGLPPGTAYSARCPEDGRAVAAEILGSTSDAGDCTETASKTVCRWTQYKPHLRQYTPAIALGVGNTLSAIGTEEMID